MSSNPRFYEILEVIETLSPEEQEDLITIVSHRQVERRRKEIAANIVQAHEEYQAGKGFRGTINEVITELMK